MMDTQELPIELQKAVAKHNKREDRVDLRQGYGQTDHGMAITERYIVVLATAFKEALKVSLGEANNAHNKNFALVAQYLSPEVVALSALQTCLHSVARQDTWVQTLKSLGTNIAGECWAAKLTVDSPRLAASIQKSVMQRHAGLKQRKQAARSAAARAGFKQKHWSGPMSVAAGGFLMTVVLQALPEVFVRAEIEDSNYQLTITEGALALADAAVAAMILRNPVFQPVTEPPEPWAGWRMSGGDVRTSYYVTFLRSRYKDTASAVKHAIRTGQMQPALDAVNALQSVAWKINKPVLDVMLECRAQGIDVPGLPPLEDLMVPERCAPDADDKEIALRKIRVQGIKKANRAFAGERVLFTEDLEGAVRLADYERFWTPMNCDWRGRIYGVCHFNFQREDRARGLFLFADGEPIGEEGLFWLKVHVANCGDFDKISKRPFKERAAWVDSHLDQITAVSDNPMGSQRLPWWTKADKPFLFLAACIELATALSVGPAYVTRLPVSFDGSCSGLQHLCAMTRADEGSLVNLTSSTVPQDVYQTIADRVIERLFQDLEAPDDESVIVNKVERLTHRKVLARMFLDHGMSRKVSKRNVMTYSYSSKKFGMASQQHVDLMEPLALEVLKGNLEEHPFHPFQTGSKEQPAKAARYISGHVFDAIEEKIRRPALAMKFLQSIAKAMAHEGKPVRWTTPVGLPWINRYHEINTQRVNLWMVDRGVRSLTRVTVAVDHKAAIDKDKAANGIAPNFVHALDAAHLLLVARRCASEGIHQIATVHDSFGCLASRASQFNRAIREEFVTMYETHDVLSEILETASCDLTDANRDKLPSRDDPGCGTLDLREVLNADFAFA